MGCCHYCNFNNLRHFCRQDSLFCFLSPQVELGPFLLHFFFVWHSPDSSSFPHIYLLFTYLSVNLFFWIPQVLELFLVGCQHYRSFQKSNVTNGGLVQGKPVILTISRKLLVAFVRLMIFNLQDFLDNPSIEQVYACHKGDCVLQRTLTFLFKRVYLRKKSRNRF